MNAVPESFESLLSPTEVDACLARMADAIRAECPDGTGVALIGIQTGGVLLARQLAKALESVWPRPVPVGELDINMHRDDLHRQFAPTVHPTHIPFDIGGLTVVLVDDVLASGRTTRAALDALSDLGRPRCVQLAVLIDRGHRELPIQADFVGRRVTAGPADRVHVSSDDGTTFKVVLEKASVG